MADPLAFDPPLEDIEDEKWLPSVIALAERNGWAERIGEHHHALYLDRAPSLFVTFERMDEVQEAAPGAEPAGILYARESGWSALTILSERRTWFRDEGIYDFFDRLIDDGFFDEFDEVVFYGAGPDCGYAACAFSVAAPGARVITLAPMATGNPRIAGWDTRFMEARRLDFTTRYGFAPEMVEAAEAVCVVHDPEVPVDAMHAALFVRPNVRQMRMRHFGRSLDIAMHRMSIWSEIVGAFAAGELDDARFARLMRARRGDFYYMRGLSRALQSKGQRTREALVLRSLEIDHRFFRRRSRVLREEMDREGDPPLPPPLGSVEAELDAEAS